MKLIVGLGNPGRKYELTRHNIGFTVAAKVAALVSASPSKVRFEGQAADAVAAGEKLVILWPQTYMNASGQSVRKAVDFYKLSAKDVLVICDDLNLPSGRLRLRSGGSAGGQKGLSDIIRHLGTEDFARLRIGIGRPPEGWDVTDFVLGKFSGEENDKIDEATTQAAKAAIDWAIEGATVAMNRHNTVPNQKTPAPKTKKQSDKKTQIKETQTETKALRPPNPAGADSSDSNTPTTSDRLRETD